MMMAPLISPALDCREIVLIDSTEYPAKMIINGKTLMVMEPWQLKYINDHFIIGLDECEMTRDSLYNVVADFLNLYHSQDVLIRSQAATIDTCSALHLSDLIIHSLDSAEIKHQQKKLWWKNFGMYAGWTVAVAEIVIFAVLKAKSEL